MPVSFSERLKASVRSADLVSVGVNVVLLALLVGGAVGSLLLKDAQPNAAAAPLDADQAPVQAANETAQDASAVQVLPEADAGNATGSDPSADPAKK